MWTDDRRTAGPGTIEPHPTDAARLLERAGAAMARLRSNCRWACCILAADAVLGAAGARDFGAWWDAAATGAFVVALLVQFGLSRALWAIDRD
jgi:hypothetical protein